ncbi:MAG: aminomethyl-transferring glycine dehydrogenase subunit GcvPA [Deltaproteobacteria bacterium]|nr:aminomethyl-transferring glycine dehydrogenase subunit GcvPA [Deltaproteobacteria bacterium]
MRYLPHSPEEVASMLASCGVGSLDDLFLSIPDDVRLRRPLAMDPALDEPSLMRHIRELGESNAASRMLSFLGAGAYDHVFPAAADQLLLRSEFYTAYTPYQPEVAQGTLQVIFEFQTIVSEILGLPVANASMYDASTGVAEAVLMARRLTNRDRMILCGSVHPEHAATVKTYTRELDHGRENWVDVPATSDGCSDLAALTRAIDDKTACVVVGYPSFYGSVTELRELARTVQAAGALFITVTLDPFALALVESPGAMGADIAVAEGQALGLPPQFGGPGVGLFACKQDRKMLQQLPGRIVGETVDKDGKRGYVLTLATREQHIRRERATSNICTNSGLCATALTIKMCMLGKRGFIEAAELCLSKARYLADRIAALPGHHIVSRAPFFNEFIVELPEDATTTLDRLATKGILGGINLGRISPARANQLLLAVTEKHSRADLDRLVTALG